MSTPSAKSRGGIQAGFLREGGHVVPEGKQVRLKFGVGRCDSLPDDLGSFGEQVVEGLVGGGAALGGGVCGECPDCAWARA